MDSRNPYGAPQAKLADPASQPGSPYKAVLLGLLTDFGGTIALSVLIALAYGIQMAAYGASPEEIEAASKSLPADSWAFWAGTIGGGGFSVLGGYVCARIAGQSEYTLGVILAAISMVLGMVLSGGGGDDVGMQVVLHAASIACVIVGSHIGKTRNRRARDTAAPAS
jgi:hypothetical protein